MGKKYVHFISTSLFMFIITWCAHASTESQNSFFGGSPRINVIKARSYQHDTVAIIWYDTNGDGVCDLAEGFKKKDGYFIVKPLQCNKADTVDILLEPRI
jgi:hypothetical protein